MFGNVRHIITLVIVLALGVGVYYLASNQNMFTGHHKRAESIEKRTVELEQEIIAPLNRLTSVNIDERLFVSPEYTALTDMSVTLRPPALVRSNPFAPAE